MDDFASPGVIPDGLGSISLERHQAFERFGVIAIVDVVGIVEGQVALHATAFRVVQKHLHQFVVALTPRGGRNSSALANVNTVAFIPMPKASATTTAALDTGRLASIRAPKRTSRHHSPGERIPRCDLCLSVRVVTFPNCRRAVRAESFALIPCAL